MAETGLRHFSLPGVFYCFDVSKEKSERKKERLRCVFATLRRWHRLPPLFLDVFFFRPLSPSRGLVSLLQGAAEDGYFMLGQSLMGEKLEIERMGHQLSCRRWGRSLRLAHFMLGQTLMVLKMVDTWWWR